MPESRDELRKRLGCYLLIAVSLTPFYLLIAGIPASASGSKPASCGWMLIVFSTIPAITVDLVLIVAEFFR